MIRVKNKFLTGKFVPAAQIRRLRKGMVIIMRKKLSLWLILLMTVLLAGCGSAAGTGEQTDSEGEESAEDEENAEDEEGTEDEESADEDSFLQERKGSLILEDEKNIYVCGTYRLFAIDKESMEEKILWENEGTSYRGKEYLFAEGSALLLRDRIYFIEAWTEDDGQTELKALSVIDTEGRGYQRIRQVPEDFSSVSLLLEDSGLYLRTYEKALVFSVNEDGTLSEQGTAEAGENPLLAGEIINFNSQYLLTTEFNEVQELYLTDRDTGEKRLLIQFDTGAVNVFGMDEEFVYTETGVTSWDEDTYVFEQISLSSGERSELFRIDSLDIPGQYSPVYLSKLTVQEGYLYYSDAEDYKLYLVRRNLADPDVKEILGEAYYDSGISQVGDIESYRGALYSQSEPDRLLEQIDLEWLKVDDRFQGAEAINRILEERQKENIEYAESTVQWMEEDERIDGIYYSYSSSLPGISYFDGRLFSFCQQDYDYSGGAHGMPIWIGYTFDLNTGKRLVLRDLVVNTEEELREIVTRHFREMIEKNPDEYWGEEAVDIVYSSVSFESPFYLDQEGIVFYYDPYTLAPYAGGFKCATIPYEEFRLNDTLVGYIR